MKKITLLIIFVFTFPRSQVYSLKDCIEIAMLNKETLKSTVQGIYVAQQGKKGALSTVLPSIAFRQSWSETNTPKNIITSEFDFLDSTFSFSNTTGGLSNSFNSSLSITQPIFNAQTLHSIQLASTQLDIAKIYYRQQKMAIIYNVYKDFFELLKAQQLLDVSRKTLDLARQQIEMVELQYDLGAVKITDLLKARVQLGKSQTEVLLKETVTKNALLSLKNSMGILQSETPFQVADVGRPLLPTMEMGQAERELTEYNPELLILHSQVLTAELQRKINVGSRLPSLNASYNYGAITDAFKSIGEKENWSSSASLSFSVPIFSGFAISTTIQKAELEVKKYQYDYVSKKNDLLTGLEQVMNTLENYQEIIPVNTQVLESAEEDLKLVQERYSLGSASILEVLDAQVSLSQAQSTDVTTKYDARIYEAQLRFLLGTLDQDFQ